MPNQLVSLDVQGAAEARDALEFVAENIYGASMVNAMRRASIVIERDAKRFAPVDTGRLRSSITHAVRVGGFPPVLQGVVGSNVKYAPYMEFGTGTFVGKPPHRMPPISALERWASRHGTSAFIVARAIMRRGGLEPREYFKQSVEKNEDKIVDILGDGIAATIRRS